MLKQTHAKPLYSSTPVPNSWLPAGLEISQWSTAGAPNDNFDLPVYIDKVDNSAQDTYVFYDTNLKKLNMVVGKSRHYRGISVDISSNFWNDVLGSATSAGSLKIRMMGVGSLVVAFNAQRTDVIVKGDTEVTIDTENCDDYELIPHSFYARTGASRQLNRIKKAMSKCRSVPNVIFKSSRSDASWFEVMETIQASSDDSAWKELRFTRGTGSQFALMPNKSAVIINTGDDNWSNWENLFPDVTTDDLINAGCDSKISGPSAYPSRLRSLLYFLSHFPNVCHAIDEFYFVEKLDDETTTAQLAMTSGVARMELTKRVDLGNFVHEYGHALAGKLMYAEDRQRVPLAERFKTRWKQINQPFADGELIVIRSSNYPDGSQSLSYEWKNGSPKGPAFGYVSPYAQVDLDEDMADTIKAFLLNSLSTWSSAFSATHGTRLVEKLKLLVDGNILAEGFISATGADQY